MDTKALYTAIYRGPDADHLKLVAVSDDPAVARAAAAVIGGNLRGDDSPDDRPTLRLLS